MVTLLLAMECYPINPGSYVYDLVVSTGNNDYANSVFGHFLGGGGIAKAMDAIMGGVDIAIATPIVAASTLGIFPVTSVPLEKKRHTP
jgi:hypothetical protein